jgi:hypothetical protein
MYLESLCTPAVLFVMIMLFHVIFEIYDKNYSMALVKVVSSIFMILFLQLLCAINMEVIGWIIVFLPLIIYTYITVVLFFVFGTHPEEAIRRFEVNK